MRRTYAVVLGLLALAFLLRVLGQLLVALFHVDFLPPMDQWYSGLLPYPILVPLQFLTLSVQANIVSDIWRNAGLFAARRPHVGKRLCWVSYAYFAVMLLRYVVTMALYPERRWLGTGTIPVFFHWVLAAYLFVLGRYQMAADGDVPASAESPGEGGYDGT